MTMALWISSTVTPYGNPGKGSICVMAESREEAIKRAREGLEAMKSTYAPKQRRIQELLANLEHEEHGMQSVGDVFVDLGID
jgi:hypothetical protein